MSVGSWSPETWVMLATFVGGSAAAVAAAVINARRSREDEAADDEHYGPRPHIVRLHEDDRTWLTRLLHDTGDKLKDALDEHRRAIHQQTDELERGRRERE